MQMSSSTRRSKRHRASSRGFKFATQEVQVTCAVEVRFPHIGNSWRAEEDTAMQVDGDYEEEHDHEKHPWTTPLIRPDSCVKMLRSIRCRIWLPERPGSSETQSSRSDGEKQSQSRSLE
jgi:hypothetical protein